MTAWHCQGGHKEDLQEGRTVGQSWPRVVQRTTQIYFMNRLPEPSDICYVTPLYTFLVTSKTKVEILPLIMKFFKKMLWVTEVALASSIDAMP